LASLIITASSTGPTLALNPILTNQIDGKSAQTIEYSIERPTSTASGAIYDKIIEASAKYGIDTDNALRIAHCESNFRQYNEDGNVLHGKVNPADSGIFQINEKWHLEASQTLDLDIHTTKGNIEYAMRLLKKEGNRHWNWSKPCWGGDGPVKNV
jgi:soluble lytic murein transglycosylase-like protein